MMGRAWERYYWLQSCSSSISKSIKLLISSIVSLSTLFFSSVLKASICCCSSSIFFKSLLVVVLIIDSKEVVNGFLYGFTVGNVPARMVFNFHSDVYCPCKVVSGHIYYCYRGY